MRALFATATRSLIPVAIAACVAFGLFWLMQYLVIAPEGDVPEQKDYQVFDVVQLAPKPEPETPPEPTTADDAPPPPPAASAPEPMAALPNLPRPVATAPAMLNVSMDMPTLDLPKPKIPQRKPAPVVASAPVAAATPAKAAGKAKKPGKLSIGGDGSFLGFAGGAGNGQVGTGKGFSGGRRIIPVSTARPQIPEYAYRRGIEGWVEVVFVVDKNGQVNNVRIVDAQPKGIFEHAAVTSIKKWQYDSQDMRGRSMEMMQRVEFKLSDFQLNWN